MSVLLGLASLLTFIPDETVAHDFFGLYNIFRLLTYGLFLAFFLLLVRGAPQIGLGTKTVPTWAKKLVLILPIVAVVIALINAFLPDLGSIVRMSDNNIFLRPGASFRMLCQLVALGFFASLIVPFLRRKKWLPAAIVIVLSLILFVMAGEEISWGQRAFQWETTGYFAEHNKQSETNLHNIATQLFQNTLFFGGFVLLIVLPFLHDQLARLFTKVRFLAGLVDFLPQPWMMVAFGAGLTFIDPFDAVYGWHWGSISFQMMATIAILAAVTLRLHRAKDQDWRIVVRTLVCALIVLTLSLSFSNFWYKNNGLPTEYIKSYVSLGIVCWAISVRQRYSVRLSK